MGPILFWIALGAAVIIAALVGTVRDKLFAVMLVLGALATAIVQVRFDWHSGIYALLAVDLAILIGALSFALTGKSHWPVWFAGFHAISVMAELATIAAPGYSPTVLGLASTFWVVPGWIVMTMGILLDRQHQAISQK